MEDMKVMMGAAELADLFGVSARQIELLTRHGVLENRGTTRRLLFDVAEATREYCNFLQSGVSLRDWCPDV